MGRSSAASKISHLTGQRMPDADDHTPWWEALDDAFYKHPERFDLGLVWVIGMRTAAERFRPL